MQKFELKQRSAVGQCYAHCTKKQNSWGTQTAFQVSMIDLWVARQMSCFKVGPCLWYLIRLVKTVAAATNGSQRMISSKQDARLLFILVVNISLLPISKPLSVTTSQFCMTHWTNWESVCIFVATFPFMLSLIVCVKDCKIFH